MKIAMFGHKRIPSREGGVEIVVEQLAVRMVSLGHSVTCWNRGGHHVSGSQFDTKDHSSCQGVNLKTVPTVDLRGIAAVSASFFATIAASFSNAEVVHIHAEGPAFLCWLPKLMGKKVIVTVHGLDWQREKWKQGIGAKFIRMGERMAVRWADSIIVLSRNVQQYFRDTYSRETVYIPNGVTKPELVAGESILQEYGLESRGYILYLGRLVPEKGIHYLLEAFKAIKTDLKLVIAGGRSDADDYVTKLLASSEDDDRVIFTDFVQGQTLDALYSNAYMYVLPSDVEGMPLSLLEAMSYGNCCLVSNIAECAEVVEDKAVTFEKGNVTQLAEKLQQLCDDPNLTQKYRDQAASFICDKYHWDGVVTKTLELYE